MAGYGNRPSRGAGGSLSGGAEDGKASVFRRLRPPSNEILVGPRPANTIRNRAGQSRQGLLPTGIPWSDRDGIRMARRMMRRQASAR